MTACLPLRRVVGHNAVLVSSCELEYAMNGIPAGMYNWEEYIYAAERICNSTKLPVIIDGENGGGTPMQVYRNVKRLAEVGAMAISIEDTNSGAFATATPTPAATAIWMPSAGLPTSRLPLRPPKALTA